MSRNESIATPALPTLAVGQVVVRIVADLRRQVERYRQARRALRQQVMVPFVRFLRRRETGICRIVHSFVRYISACTPRVNGNSPAVRQAPKRDDTPAGSQCRNQ